MRVIDIKSEGKTITIPLADYNSDVHKAVNGIAYERLSVPVVPEAIKVQEPEMPVVTSGDFTPEEEVAEESIDEIDENTCGCGKVCKSAFGLKSHQRSCKSI